MAVLGLALSPATLLAQETGETGATAPPEPAPTPLAPPPEDEAPPAPAPAEPPPAEEPVTPPPVAEEPATAPAATVLRQGGASVSMLDFSYSPASIQIDQG